jgi:hypothetical protein
MYALLQCGYGMKAVENRYEYGERPSPLGFRYGHGPKVVAASKHL